MKKNWENTAELYKIDRKRHIYDARSNVYNATFLSPGIHPLLLHIGMFLSCIQKLASDEQNDWWLEKASKLEMVGCYAQTELGHGSNVAGIETTCTLDKATDEWVLHSPTVTSTKFWPGGMGLWATHAVVFARCIVGKNDYSVMPFLVQIRDRTAHKHMPGVKVGDLGSKFGYDAKDNGWIMFNQVRIPRTN